MRSNSLVREVDPVGVDGPRRPVGEDLVAVLALHLHGLVLVHQGDVLGQVAPVQDTEEVGYIDTFGSREQQKSVTVSNWLKLCHCNQLNFTIRLGNWDIRKVSL